MTPSPDELARGLRERINAALVAMDANAILGYIEDTIKARTSRGEYLEGSTPGHRRYHDRAHIRRRQQKGLQVAHVDLLFSGHMLDSMKGRSEPWGEGIRLAFGYLDGLSETSATELARFHNELGGSAGDKRVFVGLTDAEEDELFRVVDRQLARLL